MKKCNLPKAIRAMFAHRTYYATVCVAGRTVKLEITAPDYHRARIEAEYILDDCGFVLDLVEA